MHVITRKTYIRTEERMVGTNELGRQEGERKAAKTRVATVCSQISLEAETHTNTSVSCNLPRLRNDLSDGINKGKERKTVRITKETKSDDKE